MEATRQEEMRPEEHFSTQMRPEEHFSTLSTRSCVYVCAYVFTRYCVYVCACLVRVRVLYIHVCACVAGADVYCTYTYIYGDATRSALTTKKILGFSA